MMHSTATPRKRRRAVGSNRPYTPFIAFVFSVNYILGCGSYCLPYAVAAAGWAGGALLLVAMAAVSLITCLWVAETGVRYTALRKLQCGGVERAVQALRDGSVGSRCVEVTDLCLRFLPRYCLVLYKVCSVSLLVIGLLAYSQLFQQAVVASFFPKSASWEPVLVFAIIAIPLSLLDLTEQISLQVFMAGLRLVCLVAMLVSCVYGLSVQAPSEPLASVRVEGLSLMFSTALFASLFQHSVPGLVHPLAAGDRKAVKGIFGSALLSTVAVYLALGIVCAVYYGQGRVAKSVNLNWVEGFKWAPNNQVLNTLSHIIVLFPAVDTLSVFPLIAVTLGNNFVSVWLALRSTKKTNKSTLSQHLLDNDGCADSSVNHDEVAEQGTRVPSSAGVPPKPSRLVMISCRLLSAIPPVVLSFFVHDLSWTILVSGIVAVYVALITPALLQLSSCKECTKMIGQKRTMHSWQFSGPVWSYGVLLFASAFLVLLLVQITQTVISMV